jgi:hypothetical protein
MVSVMLELKYSFLLSNVLNLLLYLCELLLFFRFDARLLNRRIFGTRATVARVVTAMFIVTNLKSAGGCSSERPNNTLSHFGHPPVPFLSEANMVSLLLQLLGYITYVRPRCCYSPKCSSVSKEAATDILPLLRLHFSLSTH